MEPDPKIQQIASSWVEQYSDYLYSYAISRTFRKEIAEDLVQDTFLSAIRSYSGFEGKSSIQTWLVSILKNKIVDHFRKASNTREKMIIDQNWEEDGYEYPFRNEEPYQGHWKKGRYPGGHGADILSIMENEEFREILEICLSLLPPKWAAAFALKVMEELESEKVCKELDISASNLWVILHRSRLKLRECLEKRWVEQ